MKHLAIRFEFIFKTCIIFSSSIDIIHIILFSLLLLHTKALQCQSDEILLTIERQNGYNADKEKVIIYEYHSDKIWEHWGVQSERNKFYEYTVCLKAHTDYETHLGTQDVFVYDKWSSGSWVSFKIDNHYIILKARADEVNKYILFRSTFETVCTNTQIKAYMYRQNHQTKTGTERTTIYPGRHAEGTSIKSIINSSSPSLCVLYEVCLQQHSDYTVELTSTENGWFDGYGSNPSTVEIYSQNGVYYMPSVSLTKSKLHYYRITTKTECNYNEIVATITRQFDPSCVFEHAFLYEGNDTSITAVWSKRPHLVDCGTMQEFNVCLTQNTMYTLKLNDYQSLDKTWKPLSYISISINNNFVVHYARYTGEEVVQSFTTPFIGQYCLADGEWPQIQANRTSFKSCPQFYSGSRTRYCNIDIYEPEVNTCVLDPPLSFSYPQISYIYSLRDNLHISPMSIGLELSYSIDPNLPTGLSFSNVTGIITGYSSELFPASLFVITCTNPSGNLTTSLSLAIVAPSCLQDGEWPETQPGHTVTLPCSDQINYEGNRTRTCLDDISGSWDSPIVLCQLIAASITYPTNHYTFYKGIIIPTISPTLTGGNLRSLTIDPSLPSGILFVPTSGGIYGTPTTTSPSTTYTVTVSNDRNSQTFNLSIEVQVLYCSQDEEWAQIEAGMTAIHDCSDTVNYSGQITRTCTLSYPVQWDNVHNECNLIPPYILYPTSSISGFKNDTFQSITPTLRGGLLNPLTISPNLPSGISFNTLTGTISGSTQEAISEFYTVTASNNVSTSTTIINIIINKVYCSNEGIWNRAERGYKSYNACSDTMHGIQTRDCVYSGVGTAEWIEPDTSNCFIYNESEEPGENQLFIHIPILITGISKYMMETSQTIETFRQLLYTKLSSIQSIQSQNVTILSVTELSIYTNIQVNVRIHVFEEFKDQVVSITNQFVDDHKHGDFSKDVSCDNNYLCSIKMVSMNKDSIVYQSNKLSALLISLCAIGVVVILLLIAILVIVCNKKKSKQTKVIMPHKQINNNQFTHNNQNTNSLLYNF